MRRSRVGRLPWRSLGIDQLRDGYGEPLWYVLSRGFRNPPINFGTLGQINYNGGERGRRADRRAGPQRQYDFHRRHTAGAVREGEPGHHEPQFDREPARSHEVPRMRQRHRHIWQPGQHDELVDVEQ